MNHCFGSFVFWPLHCLHFFDLRLLITIWYLKFKDLFLSLLPCFVFALFLFVCSFVCCDNVIKFASDLRRVGGFLWILRVCQWFTTGRWFSLDTPVFSSNKTYRHDIILFKVVLSTITLTPLIVCLFVCFHRTRDHPKAFFTQR